MQNNCHLSTLIHEQAKKYGSKPVLNFRMFGSLEWKAVSWKQFSLRVKQVSNAMLNLGIQPQENIAVFSQNCIQYLYTDFGAYGVRVVSIPIYATSSEQQIQYVVQDAGVRFLFVGEQEQYDKAHRIFPLCPTLERIIIFDHSVRISTHDPNALYFEDFVALGENLPRQSQVEKLWSEASMDDVCNIIYTSGTTGTPKGVMLAHRGLIMNVQEIKHSPSPEWTRALSWLPMCHIYERMMGYLYQWLCFEIAYAESIAKVGDNCKELSPHMLACVPRFIEKVYDKIYRKGEKMKGLRKKIFDWALDLAFHYDLDESKLSCWYKLQRRLADRLVYKEIRASMGGQLGMLVSGGATIQPRLTRFFSCVGLDLYEGYGITECSPLIAVTNSDKKGRKIGSVGFAMREIEVRIDKDTNEIQCRGGNVMKGYYNQPELTAQAIDAEGWFHTGDTGYFDPDGYLFITGRTKSMFKTSMGKFINPEVIEEKMKQSPFILDMMVVGAEQKFAAALIAPDFDMLKDWCLRHGVDAQSREEMIADKRVVARFQKVVDKYNAELGVTEQVRKFALVADAWTEANKMLTPTQKLIRRNVAAAYREQIDALFN